MKILTTIKCLGLVFISTLLFSCTYNKELPEPEIDPQNEVTTPINITYNLHVKNIIDNNCISCHSSAGLGIPPFLVSYKQVKIKADEGRIQARAIDENPSVMPPSASLPQAVKDTIQLWINQGAL